MAIGRRALNARQVILKGDSAIVADDIAYKDYLASFFDESKLTFIPGDAPTRWMIRQLSDEQKDAVLTQQGVRAGARMAIRCGLLGVTNYRVTRDDGSEIEWPQPEFTDDPRLGKIVTERWIRDMGLLTEQMGQLYQVIDYMSEAQHPLASGSDKLFGPGGG